jgi:hypothetical protein
VNTLEDRLRDAYSALADTVDPATIPDRAVSTGPRATVPRRTLLASALAAAAVVAIVAVLTTIPRGTSAGHRPHAAKVRPTAAARVPKFTVVIKGPALAVYRTRSGVSVATIAPPARQQFELVASGGTARTFLAATHLAGSACHAYFYRFELSASGRPSPLTFLRSVPGSLPSALAATPGGGSYAYSTVHCATAPPNGEIGISGQAGNRTWAYNEADNYAFSLAATADGHTLAFSLVTPSGDMLLNTSSAARTVDGASRVLRSVPASPTLAISPDGQTLYTCASSGPTVTLAAYSIATGAQIRVLHRWPDHQGLGQEPICLISLDPTGRFLLAAVAPAPLQASTLIGFDLRTSAPVTIPVRAVLRYRGTQYAW